MANVGVLYRGVALCQGLICNQSQSGFGTQHSVSGLYKRVSSGDLYEGSYCSVPILLPCSLQLTLRWKPSRTAPLPPPSPITTRTPRIAPLPITILLTPPSSSPSLARRRGRRKGRRSPGLVTMRNRWC